MDTSLSTAFQLLRRDIPGRLNDAEILTRMDHWSEEDARAARALIGDLAMITRGLLLEQDFVKTVLRLKPADYG